MDISDKIEEGIVTRDDFNYLIETSYKSAQERILRRTRARDSNDGHDDEGHAGPPLAGARAAPRRGGGRLNDPRRTARGRRAVAHQEGTYKEATEFILEHRGQENIPIDEIVDRSALKNLTARLLTVDGANRDWLYALYRKLED